MGNPNIGRLRLGSLYAVTCVCFLLVACQKEESLSSDVKDQSEAEEKRFTQAYREAVERHENKESVAENLYDFMLASQPQDERMQAVWDFCQKQEIQDLNGILELFRHPCPEDIDSSVWLLVANEVMKFCQHQRLEGLSARLIDLAQSSEVDPTIKDYAMQYYFLDQRDILNASQGNEDARSEVVNRMKTDLDALFSDPDAPSEGTVFGTSMMTLTSVIEGLAPESVENQELVKSVDALVMPILRGEQSAMMPNRVAAIQTAGRLKLPGAGPIIAQIAWDKERKPSERISALASLRYFPADVDRKKLEELTRGRKQFRFAAQSTLNYLQNTLTSQTQD